MFSKLKWRLKIGWKCVGGHYVNERGENAGPNGKFVGYCYVFMHNKTHAIKTQIIQKNQREDAIVEHSYADEQIRRTNSRIFSAAVFVLAIIGGVAIFFVLACLAVACN